jgi:glycine cleavage system H protein
VIEEAVTAAQWEEIEGYRLAMERAYDPDTDIWVQVRRPGRVRLGIDPLGVETAGTLAQIALEPVGVTVARGQPLGTMEAEKFVGPLAAPLSGTVLARNEAAEADPGLVQRDPLGDGWLIELAPQDLSGEGALLIRGPDRIRDWFVAKVADYRLKGVLAE